MPWRTTLSANLRHMTPDQAMASLRRIQLRIGFVGQPEVCRLTGLESHEVTPLVVQQVCEQLAARTPQGMSVAAKRHFDPTEQAD
jgi:hypothetical protein